MFPVTYSIMLKIRRRKREEESEHEFEDYEKEALEVIEEAKKREEVKKEETVFEEPLIDYSPPPGWNIVEEYWIQEPYCKVYIKRDSSNGRDKEICEKHMMWYSFIAVPT